MKSAGKITKAELDRIFTENGGYSLNNPYTLTNGHGVTALLDKGGQVHYYVIENEAEFAEWIQSLDNVGKLINHQYVSIFQDLTRGAER